jgi:BP28CT (NUC211) domain
MALSSLGAQLAGLQQAGNNDKKNVGSILNSSTRHDDAIGRGVTHSVQVGHSLLSKFDPRLAPSLLYSDAKKASDIPVAILWENCDLALQELAQTHYPPLQRYVAIGQDSLLRQSRHNNNNKPHRKQHQQQQLSLTNLLTILSTLLPHDATNCGHVLEYLVRRYNIHVAAADTLLMMLLPHCDSPTCKGLFHRALELVNIMGAVPTQHSWIWLRPYVPTTTVDGNNQTVVPPRHVVARHVVAPHTALLQQVCAFTQTVAQVMPEATHRGRAQILAWSATIMVEGLHHLQTRQTLPQTQESILRVLLPVCIQACSTSSSSQQQQQTIATSDWTAWGRVVASVAAETMELAPFVKQRLCQSILQGVVVVSSSSAQKSNNNDEEDEDTVMAMADALVAVTSICLPPNTVIPDPWNATVKTWKECVVIPFPIVLETIWNQVKHGVLLPTVVRHVLTERKLDRMKLAMVIPLTIWAVLHVPDNAEEQLRTLLRDESLRQVLWTKQWIESFSEWLLWMLMQDDCDNDNDHDDTRKDKQVLLVQALLKELRKLDAKACETGMAVALQDVQQTNLHHQSMLKVLLQGVLPTTTANESSSSPSSGNKRGWMPPRVALEHGDATMRIQAMEELIQEYEKVQSQENPAMDMDNDITESIPAALGRRMACDDSPKVVLAAANGLLTLLCVEKASKSAALLVEDTLQCLYKWTSFNNKSVVATPEEKTERKKKRQDRITEEGDTIQVEVDGVVELIVLKKKRKRRARIKEEVDTSQAELDGGQESIVVKKKRKRRARIKEEVDTSQAELDGGQESIVLKKKKKRRDRIKEEGGTSQAEVDGVQEESIVLKKKKKRRDRIKEEGDTSQAELDGVQESIIIRCLQLLGSLSDSSSSSVLEALTAHLEHWSAEVSTAATRAIIEVLEEKESSSASSNDAKMLLLLERYEFCGSLLLEVSDIEGRDKMIEQNLRRRSLWVMLDAMKEYVRDSSTSVVVKNVSQMAVDACLAILSSQTEEDNWALDKDRTQRVQDAWAVCTPHIAPTEYSKLLLALAALPDYGAPRDVLMKQFVEGVVDVNRDAVSACSVIMEAALHESASPTSIIRILSFVADSYLGEPKKADKAAWLCLLPSLALLESANKSVRDQSLKLLALLSDCGGSTKEWKPLAAICQEVLKKRSSAALGGVTFLPLCMAERVRADGDSLRECLLSLCLCAAVGCGRDSITTLEDMIKSPWLPFGHARGHIVAACTMLRNMELAGEEAFPLKLRWDRFGAPILKLLLTVTTCDGGQLDPAATLLCDSVVGMLKGIAVADTRVFDTLVITSGPTASGRRQRSYSVGKADGVTFVDPYPKAMTTALTDILRAARKEKTIVAGTLCKSLADTVLGRESWARSVFKKFPFAIRQEIAGEFMLILAESELHIPCDYFLGLPLDAGDVTQLLKRDSGAQTEVVATSMLADYIRANSIILMASSDASKLVTTLFELLSSLSSEAQGYSDGIEFVRQATLSALVDLMSHSATLDPGLKIADKKVKAFVDLLLSLNANKPSSFDLRPLVSQRAKAAALSLLMKLCSNFPRPVVSSLIPALTTQIEAVQDLVGDESVGERLRNSFATIVPVFWQYASHAGLSFSDLLSAFVAFARPLSNRKKADVYVSFVRAMSGCSFAEQADPFLGAIVVYFIADEVFAKGGAFEAELHAATAFALQVIQAASAVSQVASMALLLHYVDSLLLTLQARGDTESQTSYTISEENAFHIPKTAEILQVAVSGSKSPTKKSPSKASGAIQSKAIKSLVQSILLTVNDAMLLDTVRKFISRSERSNTTLSLRLWQDMLISQSTASNTAASFGDDDDSDYWDTIINVSGGTLEQMQGLMPLPIFLASAMSLVKDGETDELRAGAIRLVADRATEVDPGSPEATLFLEMASLLVGFLRVPDKPSKGCESGQFQLQQASLVAIEHIARTAGNQGKSETEKASNSDSVTTFLAALQGCADFFVAICGQGKIGSVDISKLDDAPQKLLSSAALCISTLVRVTAPKCLALLPKFMNQLVASLSSSNQYVASLADDQQQKLSEVRMMQVCVLRALSAVAETVPQFTYPYLMQLLTSSALPSKTLRGKDVDQAVLLAADGLEKSLSKRIPARVLLPVASASMPSLKAPIEYEVLLRMLRQKVDTSSGEELAGHLGPLLKAVTATYDYDCDLNLRFALIDIANDTVLALVLKLSENHLRRLFSSLRDWKGSLGGSKPEKFALRRVAFWRLCSVLSRELRMIFLPCMSSVLSDVLEELVGYKGGIG